MMSSPSTYQQVVTKITRCNKLVWLVFGLTMTITALTIVGMSVVGYSHETFKANWAKASDDWDRADEYLTVHAHECNSTKYIDFVESCKKYTAIRNNLPFFKAWSMMIPTMGSNAIDSAGLQSNTAWGAILTNMGMSVGSNLLLYTIAFLVFLVSILMIVDRLASCCLACSKRSRRRAQNTPHAHPHNETPLHSHNLRSSTQPLTFPDIPGSELERQIPSTFILPSDQHEQEQVIEAEFKMWKALNQKNAKIIPQTPHLIHRTIHNNNDQQSAKDE